MKRHVVNGSIMDSLTRVLVVFWVMLASVPKTSAIPTFSRKYQTSCTTFHNNYPELNDFGEAFKKNGFKFPKDDEVFAKAVTGNTLFFRPNQVLLIVTGAT